jgi:hypothetical protein
LLNNAPAQIVLAFDWARAFLSSQLELLKFKSNWAPDQSGELALECLYFLRFYEP